MDTGFNTYKTNDIYLASFLLASNFPIEQTITIHGKKYFVFRCEREPFILGDTWTIDKAVKSYWDKTIEIPPLQLFNAFKELKNRIYSE